MLIVFDLDGTLHQTEVVNLGAVHRALEECGLPPVTDKRIRALLDKPEEKFILGLLPGCDPLLRVKVLSRIRKYEFRSVPSKVQLYPGVQELLEKLRKEKNILAVCSYGRQEYVELVLETCGVYQFFQYVYGRRSGRNKAEVLSWLLAEANNPPAVMIGDSMGDLHAAEENGIPFIGATYGYGTFAAGFKGTLASSVVALSKAIQIYTK